MSWSEIYLKSGPQSPGTHTESRHSALIRRKHFLHCLMKSLQQRGERDHYHSLEYNPSSPCIPKQIPSPAGVSVCSTIHGGKNIMMVVRTASHYTNKFSANIHFNINKK